MSVRRPLLIWTLFCLTAGAVFLAYACASLAAGRGQFVLPLDDVYIHFQYAKQLAHGQPYIYNPGQPPTSGETSFLYPYVLALGYLLGFQGLTLGLWVMMLGGLALLGSLWLMYRLVKAYAAPDWLAVTAALIFGLTGAVSWHFMSGMETGLMMLFTLGTVYAVVMRALPLFTLSASLMALTRPEGGILAVIAVGAMFLSIRSDTPSRRQRWLLILPVLAVLVQPLVNLIVTGSAVATGSSVKSIFGLVPFYWDVVLGRIVDNFARMWAEFVTGFSLREGLYAPYLIGPLALGYLVFGLFRRRTHLIHAMLIVWLLAGAAAISTLDTAFWHFKRYQMPLLVLLFPLAGWAVNGVLMYARRTQHAASLRYVIWGMSGAGLLVALMTGAAFLHHFALNVDYVYLQPLQMARWLKANTPDDAVVAVHDVGMMRYIGDRTTLDMVGLTTPGAAAYWRNGPGSIAEFLIQNRPDYIAAYGKGHGYGLGLIANTAIYGEPLAEFPVDLDPNYNVALAADFQGIYQPDWHSVWSADSLDMPVQTLNVGDLQSEADYHYTWNNPVPLPGFSTEIHVFPINCVDQPPPCNRIDSTRLVSGYEEFTVTLASDADLQKVTIFSFFYGTQPGVTHLYVNGTLIDKNWIPVNPGGINDAITRVPLSLLGDRMLHIRVETSTPYMVYRYQILQTPGSDSTRPPEGSELAGYQDGALLLLTQAAQMETDALVLRSVWYADGHTEGDYRFFVHLYKKVDQPPVAQSDEYLQSGWVPVGNLGSGTLQEQVKIDLSDVAPGTYKLAIGFYDPYTGERLMPQSDTYEVSSDGRLWLGEVEVAAKSG